MSEPQGPREMSRRTSWTLILCCALLAVGLPVGAYGAAGTVFNLSDASKTGPDGDARITNNKLGTAVCDVSSAGVTASNCVRVSGGRLLTLDREPPTPISKVCELPFDSGYATSTRCDVAGLPAKYVVEHISLSGTLPHGERLMQCNVSIEQAGNLPEHTVAVPMEWVGSRSDRAHFVGSTALRVRGLVASYGISTVCLRDDYYFTAGHVRLHVAGYAY